MIMDSNYDFWLMIILMVVGSYFVMSNVMLTYNNGVYNHLNKGYMALLMGGLMGIIHYIIMIWHGHRSSKEIYGLIIWIIISLVFIILIRKQVFISDNEFLKGMIEHHDMALLMSAKIKEKTKNRKIQQLTDNIMYTQQQEINQMNLML